MPLHCANCKCDFYCGKECQKKDWKHHKKICNILKEQRNKTKGEVLVNNPSQLFFILQSTKLDMDSFINEPKNFFMHYYTSIWHGAPFCCLITLAKDKEVVMELLKKFNLSVVSGIIKRGKHIYPLQGENVFILF